MPITIGCTSCATSLKVADNLAGRAVKCPKCTTIIRVPASGDAAGNATPLPKSTSPLREVPVKGPAVTKSSPPPAKAKPKPPPPEYEEELEELDEIEQDDEEVEDVHADEDEDDGRKGKPRLIKDVTSRSLSIEHDVPEHLQERMNEELSKGERLIWVGQPVKWLMFVRSLIYPIFGLVFLSVSGCILSVFVGSLLGVGGNGGGGGAVGGLLIVIPVGLIFLVVSLCFIVAPFWAMHRAGRTCYALTNRRCIVWMCMWYGGTRVTNYSPAELTRMRRSDSWIYGRGCGDLIFHSVTTITYTPGRYGGVSARTTYYGFLGIENVRDVEKMVREALLDKFMDRLIN